MRNIFTAKVPITYTEVKRQGNIIHEETTVVGNMFTPNLLACMQEQKRIIDELLKR